jgi:hypothetical protein
VSKTARRRIRTFSVWIWVWGALVLFVGAQDLALPEAQRGRPDNIAYLHRQGDTILVVPGDSDLELWVRGNGSWEITLQKAALREMTDGYASDTSNVFLVYRGDAVSARFIHKGAGIFVVTIQTLGGESDQPIIESGEVDQRLSWDPTDAVYFTVEADDGRGV